MKAILLFFLASLATLSAGKNADKSDEWKGTATSMDRYSVRLLGGPGNSTKHITCVLRNNTEAVLDGKKLPWRSFRDKIHDSAQENGIRKGYEVTVECAYKKAWLVKRVEAKAR